MKQEGMEAKPRKYNIHCLYTSQLTTHIHNHAWCPVFMVDLEITRGGNQYSHLPEVLRKKKKKLTIANSTRSHFWIVKTTLLYRYICIYITFFGLTWITRAFNYIWCGMRANSVSLSYTSPRERGRLITPDGRPGTRRGLSMNQTLRESHVCRDNDGTNQSALNIKLTNIPTASRLWFLADLRHKKCMYIGINYYVQTPTSGAKPCPAAP